MRPRSELKLEPLVRARLLTGAAGASLAGAVTWMVGGLIASGLVPADAAGPGWQALFWTSCTGAIGLVPVTALWLTACLRKARRAKSERSRCV